MSLVHVSKWSMLDPPKITIRCEHGRPLGGNPCEQCGCPHVAGWGHRIRLSRDVNGYTMLECAYCRGVYEGAPYPFKSGRARK